MEFYLTIKMNEVVVHATTCIILQGINAEQEKKPIPKGFILCNSIYIAFLMSQNFRNRGQVSDYQELGKGVEREKYGYKRATQGILVYLDWRCTHELT